MSTGRVPVANVCRFVGGDQSDFEESCSSGDEWIPPIDEADDDDEEAKCRSKVKNVGRKKRRSKKEGPKPSTSAATSGTDTDDDQPLAALRRATVAEDDMPLSMLASGSLDEDNIPLAHLIDGTPNDDENLAALIDLPTWTDISFQPPDAKFKGELEKAPEDGHLKTPYQFFKELITDEMLDEVATQTNIYSMQKSGVLLNTARKEIETFIGLYLKMGLVQGHRIRSYWENGSRYPPVADNMGRDRFLKLASTLHFTNNLTVDDDTKASDKVWKLRPWLKDFRQRLVQIPAEEHNSVDEVMVAFKGKSALKQYMRGKPHPWGFKLWARCGTSGIMYDFDVYQGAADGKRRAPSPLGLGGEVVLKMVKELENGLNYKIFADNFFSSLPLAKALREKSMFFVGTFRSNRLKGCQLKTEKELKQSGRGSSDAKVEVISNVIAVRWYDNKTVDTMSTYIGLDPVGAAERYDKKEKKKISINRPAIIAEYNKFMGGVDLLDSLTALYKFQIKSRRWYMYIFYHSLAIAVVNSWLWYKRHVKLLGLKTPMKLSVFQGMIADALIHTKKPGRPAATSLSPPPPKVQRKAPVSDVRLDGVGHLPVWAPDRQRCKNRNCQILGSARCQKCDVHLCFQKGRNCFLEFHTIA